MKNLTVAQMIEELKSMSQMHWLWFQEKILHGVSVKRSILMAQ